VRAAGVLPLAGGRGPLYDPLSRAARQASSLRICVVSPLRDVDRGSRTVVLDGEGVPAPGLSQHANWGRCGNAARAAVGWAAAGSPRARRAGPILPRGGGR
jgi:hypothetical protein